MPMDFPDLRSLKLAAQVHKFRDIITDEFEEEYRTALADHVSGTDFIESEEIRNKTGWNKWSKKETESSLSRLKNGGKVWTK